MPIKSTVTGILFVLAAFFAFSAHADDRAPLWPGVEYDAAIPGFQQVLGYAVGEKITSHEDMLRYFSALAKAAPQRLKVFEYGRTWEGRQLIYVALGNPDNIQSLEQFASEMQALADPRKTSKSAATKLIEKLPASVWLQYAVHGNEISSTDAAMMTAYHLLAAPQDPINQKILQNTLVFIDPLQNPDGRSRFTSRYYATVGLQNSDDRLSAEHNEPWPQGRSNHYLFDMNRDWLALTQPETQGRVAMLNHYLPLAVIDLHEMGGDESYYFAPAAQPFNPHMSQTQINNMSMIGKNNGRHFDDFGFDYFTREVFDEFYPGYGDSWPTFYGASAATYEVASARGEVFRKQTGEQLTYRDTVQMHFVASISTAQAVSQNREKLLKDFYEYQQNAIISGKKDKNERVFILPNRRDRAGNHKLVTLMARHGVEVSQATSSFKACGKSYDAGTYFIDTAQPRGRFVKTTFTQQVDMDSAFIKEQERRRARKLNNEIYDVTGWSLPLLFNIDRDACGSAVDVASKPVEADSILVGSVDNPSATVAYLIAWGDMAAGRFLTAALQQGVVIKSSDEAFTLENKKQYPAGTLIIEKRTNSKDIDTVVAGLAKQSGALVDGINSSWVIDGPSFGSGRVVTMSAPRIAMAWDEPVSSLSAGNSRFVIERQFNYPVTAIRTQQLRTADLSRYQVLILPSGDYQEALGESGASNLKDWVDQGGVLITFGRAMQFAIEPKVGLLDVKQELAYRQESKKASSNGKKDDNDKSTTPGTLLNDKQALAAAIQSDEEHPDYVAGVMANIQVDKEHWLTAGVNKTLVSMVTGNNIYTPIKLDSGKNLAWFADEKNLLASGYLWQENRQQLAFKPFLIHQPLGRGMVIAFTQEPTTRAYMDGLNLLLMNSIFSASAHASPTR